MIKRFLWQSRYLLAMSMSRNRTKSLLLIFLFMLFLFWAAVIPSLLKAAAGNLLPELIFTRSIEYWQEYLSMIHPALKSLYLSRYLPLFPFVYGFLLAYALINLTDHIFEISSNYKLLYYLPLAAADTDLLENVLSAVAIVRYPAVNDTFLRVIVFITFIKFILLTFSLLLVVFFFIMYKKRSA